MEVTLVHPNNKDQKVVVTNEVQYEAFKSQGFVDASENQNTETEEKTKETQTKKEGAK